MVTDTHAHPVGVDSGPGPDSVPTGEGHDPDSHPNSREDAGSPKRRIAAYSALAGLLTGGWLLWSVPVTPTIPVPSPASLRPGGVNMMVLLSLLENLRDAKPLVDEERRRTEAERDAFNRFSDRVAGMDATHRVHGGGAIGDGGTVAVDVGTTDSRLREVIEAYRETVLSVPHYEEEYDEPLADHMMGEFGSEIATPVLNGRNFSPQLRDALVQAGTEAREQRDVLMRTLDLETDALGRAERVMTEVEAELEPLMKVSLHQFSFDDLSQRWAQLKGLEHRCEQLLSERQHRIHHGHGMGLRTLDGKRLHQYLYRSLDAQYPVLADGADLVDRVRTVRDRVTRAITRRV